MNPDSIVMVPIGELERFLNRLVQTAVKSAVDEALLSINAGQEYYSAEQAGVLMGVSASLVQRELKNRKKYFAGSVRYSRADVLNVLTTTKPPKQNEENEEKKPKRNDGKKVSVARKTGGKIKKEHQLSGFHKHIEELVEERYND